MILDTASLRGTIRMRSRSALRRIGVAVLAIALLPVGPVSAPPASAQTLMDLQGQIEAAT